MQQHVERIYDLVFISLFNTILGALRERERENGRGKKGSRERESERLREDDSFTSTFVFYETKQRRPSARS